MFDRFGGARVFSKLDLMTGFHQIRLKPEDVEKTGFNTKYGQFEYFGMPMGLCNAPATFQTLMN
jgi:Reverse transcriptase (RNA-dependent DNA polymerase)